MWTRTGEDDGEPLAAWPGTDCTYVKNNELGEAIYSITISVDYNRIIFNNGYSGGDNQTATIELTDDITGLYLTDSKNKSGNWIVGTYDYKG